jgi:hypothetical protein
MSTNLTTPSNYQERRAARKALLASETAAETARIEKARAEEKARRAEAIRAAEANERAFWGQIADALVTIADNMGGRSPASDPTLCRDTYRLARDLRS